MQGLSLPKNKITMKTQEELNWWWSQLNIKSKKLISGQDYPQCTLWWLSLPTLGKKDIYATAPREIDLRELRKAELRGLFSD